MDRTGPEWFFKGLFYSSNVNFQIRTRNFTREKNFDLKKISSSSRKIFCSSKNSSSSWITIFLKLKIEFAHKNYIIIDLSRVLKRDLMVNRKQLKLVLWNQKSSNKNMNLSLLPVTTVVYK